MWASPRKTWHRPAPHSVPTRSRFTIPACWCRLASSSRRVIDHADVRPRQPADPGPAVRRHEGQAQRSGDVAHDRCAAESLASRSSRKGQGRLIEAVLVTGAYAAAQGVTVAPADGDAPAGRRPRRRGRRRPRIRSSPTAGLRPPRRERRCRWRPRPSDRRRSTRR
jgi:hypothetical protein